MSEKGSFMKNRRLNQPLPQQMRPLIKLMLPVMLGITLTACGDATTNIVEKEPIVIDKPDLPVVKAGKGRLLVTDKNSGTVAVYDLDKAELINELQLVHPAEFAYASPAQRYAVLVQRSKDLVQFVDGGLYQEDHGDHLHPYAEAPQLMKFRLTGVRPTHVQGNATQLAIFNDGNSAAAAVASVDVITDQDIEKDSTAVPRFSYSTHQHGAAQPRGDYLLSTIRDAATATTLPDTVGFYKINGSRVELNRTLTTKCPALHGSAQNKDYVAFGCSDGVLWIAQNGATLTEGKIANTSDITGTARIGTVEGHLKAPHFVGMAGTSLFAIDPVSKTMQRIDWQPAAGSSIAGYGFSHDAKRFVLLDNKGTLTVLDYNGSSFTLAGKVNVVADVTAMPAGSALQLAISGSDARAYVLNPIARQVAVVDLNKRQVQSALQSNFMPHRLVWLGIGS
jgi:hypothetical protein